MSNFFAMLCPQCRRSSEFPSEAFGQWTQCPHCHSQVIAQPASEPPNPAVPFDYPPENRPLEIPDLKLCRQCHLTILKAAETCPHCGARQTPRKWVVPTVAAVAAVVLIAGVAFLTMQPPAPNEPVKSTRVLHPAIQLTGDRLSIRNEDLADWHDVELYLNGRPPFAYHFSLGDLRSGGSRLIPLKNFTLNNASFQPDDARSRISGLAARDLTLAALHSRRGS